MNLPQVAISANHLSKWFGEGQTHVMAVREVNVQAHFGEMLFLVGPSGSGKTTFLSMISGILRPSEGQVQVLGSDLWSMSADQLASFRLNHLGFVFQDFHLFPRLTAAENVAIPLILRGDDWVHSILRSEAMLETVGLPNRGQTLPVKLSGGEEQRETIARAMVGEPEIMIFDEPTASLDGDTGKKIIAFVKQNILNSKRCILIVTHDSRINEYADRIVQMENGQIFESLKGV